MKNNIYLCGIIALTMILSANLIVPGQQIRDLPEREEINKIFQLSKDARVEVNGIGGTVEIETIESGNAEVHIVSSAETRAELDCYQTVVEQTMDSLTIRREQYTSRDKCKSIRSRQRVKLLLPRSAEISLDTISGDVTVGAVDNVIRLNNIAGRVRIAQAQAAEMSNLAQGLTMSLSRLEERGMRISNVSGSIELSVSSSLNAEVKIGGILGKLFITAPNAQAIKDGSGYRILIGSNRAKIALSNITGNVTIRPI
jgi:DUF4097 and DUF4098 domain-containing protein YvlB